MKEKLKIEQHNIEIQKNLDYWKNKPILHVIYKDFYRKIAGNLRSDIKGLTVELGSGIGNIKSEIPEAICTDIFDNPWIDRVENAYDMSFEDNSVANIVLFDVFHHIQYPGNAFEEFQRVLKPGGRIVIFDPAISLLGWIVFGVLHHEPVAMRNPIVWHAPGEFDPWNSPYYAAQGNCTRVFFAKELTSRLQAWDVIKKERYSALSYVLSGGYSKPLLYPSGFYRYVKSAEKLFDRFPLAFSTRALVVLEKR